MSSTPNPTERAPLLRVYGSLAGRMASLLRFRHSLLQRIVYAPPEAMHAVAAYLHLMTGDENPIAEVAETIERRHPRDLLRLALPQAPAGLYRALARAGDRVRERKFYERVATVASGPFGATFLSGSLNDRRLDFFECLSTMDPLVVALHDVLPESRSVAEAVESVVVFLRAYGAVTDADLALPPKAGLESVSRRLLRALDRVRAPTPPFAVPPPLHLIDTVGELRRVGQRFDNCLCQPHSGQHHWLALARGETVYLTGEEPPVVVSLRRVAPDLFMLNEMAGPGNDSLDEPVRASVLDALKAAGARLVVTDPADAFSRLQRQARHGDADDGLDEAVREFEAAMGHGLAA